MIFLQKADRGDIFIVHDQKSSYRTLLHATLFGTDQQVAGCGNINTLGSFSGFGPFDVPTFHE